MCAAVGSAAEKWSIGALVLARPEQAARVWVQGIVVDVCRHGLGVSVVSMDDGSEGAGCMRVRVKDAVNPPTLRKGMYVSVIALQQQGGVFLAQKVCDLSQDPNREAMWNAELALSASQRRKCGGIG